MSTKVCTKSTCSHDGEPQSISNFPRQSRSKDGHNCWCKDCFTIAQRAYRKTAAGKATTKKYTQSEKFRVQQQRYKQSDKAKETARKYWSTEEAQEKRLINHRLYSKTEKFKATRKIYRKGDKYKALIRRRYNRVKDDPEHILRKIAHLQVKYAITRGDLPPVHTLICTHCDKPAQEYDHYLGYEEEHHLHVQPTCILCHRRIDKERRLQAQVQL